jgi:hypothetical protein
LKKQIKPSSLRTAGFGEEAVKMPFLVMIEAFDVVVSWIGLQRGALVGLCVPHLRSLLWRFGLILEIVLRLSEDFGEVFFLLALYPMFSEE